MIDPQLITPDTIMERLEAIPPVLRAAANDPAVAEIVSAICSDHHLNDEDRVLMVKQLVALVTLGIIRETDLAREINDQLELNDQKLADSVARALDEQLFAAIRDDLIKNYRPITPSSGKPGSAGASQTAEPPQEFKSSVSASTAPAFAPKPVAPTVPPSGTPAPSAAAPAPFMIHQETAFKPVAQKGDVRAAISGQSVGSPSTSLGASGAQKPGGGATSMFSGLAKPTAPPPIAAKVEIGTPEEKKSMVTRTEITAPRVVHYSDMKSPVGSGQFTVPKPSQQPPVMPQMPPAPFKAPSETQKPAVTPPPSQIPYAQPTSQSTPPLATPPHPQPMPPPPAATQPSWKPISESSGQSAVRSAQSAGNSEQHTAPKPVQPPKPVMDLRTPPISMPKQVNFTEEQKQPPAPPV